MDVLGSTYEGEASGSATSRRLDRSTAATYIWATDQANFACQTTGGDTNRVEEVSDGRRLR